VRRPGDMPMLIADALPARERLCFKAQHANVESIVRTVAPA
jgi:UDP-glucose 4-epimerase